MALVGRGWPLHQAAILQTWNSGGLDVRRAQGHYLVRNIDRTLFIGEPGQFQQGGDGHGVP